MNSDSLTESDRRKNDNHLREYFVHHPFDVKSPIECRFVRLTQTGKNHSNSDSLEFCFPEIFGSLRRRAVHLPLKESTSKLGVITYLTPKHGGNTQDEGTVTITSKSVYNDDPGSALRNIADLSSGSGLTSSDQPGERAFWDFHRTHFRPTNSTIKAQYLKSLVVEGSRDGENWTKIDQRTDNNDLMAYTYTAAFAVSAG
jgi:hypothetical protein